MPFYQGLTRDRVSNALDQAYSSDNSYTISLLFGGTVNLGTGASQEMIYRRIGRLVDGWYSFTIGSSPSLGAGPWYIANTELPYAAATPIGSGQAGGFGAAVWSTEGLLEMAAPVVANIGAPALVFFSPPGDGVAGNIAGQGNPMPLGEGATLVGRFEYNAASSEF